jgi:uncharacterized protein involved in exopolysaccharide biosynthesis
MSDQKPPKEPPVSSSPPYPGYPPYVVYPEEAIDWRAYWTVMIQHRKLIGFMTGVSTILALLIAFLLTPIYRAEVLLAPVSDENTGGLGTLVGQFGDLAALAGTNLGTGKDKTAEYVAALKSRVVTTDFINQENLKPALFPRKWDTEGKKWKDPDDVPTDWEAFELFDRGIRFVQLDRKTGLVTLAIEWKDPVLAAKWANDLVKRLNDQLRTDAVKEAENSIGFLQKELARTGTVELQQAIYRLIEVQTKKEMVARTRQDYAFKVVDPAVSPERKVRPKRLLITVLGFMVGLMLAVSVVFIRNATNTRRVQTDSPRR